GSAPQTIASRTQPNAPLRHRASVATPQRSNSSFRRRYGLLAAALFAVRRIRSAQAAGAVRARSRLRHRTGARRARRPRSPGGRASSLEDVYPQLVAESVELRPLTKPPVRATHRHRHRRRDEVLVGVDRRAGAMIELTAPIGAQV